MQMYFDVWPADDPIGTALGHLSDIEAKTIRAEWNGLGSGQFTINRHSSQIDWTATGNLVRVRLVTGGPFAYDDARYKFAFWLDEGDDVAVSPEEEGGETFTRGGRGPLAYVEDALLDYQALTYPEGPQDDGTWRWRAPEQFGSIWRRVIDEAQASGFLPDLTYDFTDLVDTDGNAWEDFGEEFRLEMGLNLLAIAGVLRAQGLQVGMTPALVAQAWQDYSSPVRSITFEKGVNIREAAQRKVHASVARSRYLVQGRTEDGTMTFAWVTDAGVETALGRPKAGFLRYQHTATTANLQRAGQEAINALDKQRVGPTSIGVLIREDEEPFVDYFPGDTVTVDIPDVFDESAVQIHAIVLEELETGELDAVLEFEDSAFDGSGELPAVNDSEDGAVTVECCPPETPYVCNPQSRTLPTTCNDPNSVASQLFLGPVGGTSGAYTNTRSSDAVSLYAGATYRATYTIDHETSSVNGDPTKVLKLNNLSQDAGVAHMGGETAGNALYFADVDFTVGALAGGAESDCFELEIIENETAGRNMTGSFADVTVSYLSGSDPRFTGFGSFCGTPPSVGQLTRESVTVIAGAFQTNFPYEPRSIHFQGLPVVVDETDPDAGEGTVALPDGTYPVHYQIASTSETGAENEPPPAGINVIPPALLSADTPTDGQVLTWQTGDTTTWETPSGGSSSLDWVFVTDHGTVGDDTADDTAEIQAALDATPEGGVCYFPLPSVAYKITAALNIPHQMTLRGGGAYIGQHTKIRQATANTSAFVGPATDGNLIFEGLQITGTIGGQTAGYGIHATTSIHIEGCLLQGFYSGLYIETDNLTQPVYYSRVAHSFFDSATRAGIELIGGVNNFSWVNCRAGSNAWGVLVDGGPYSLRFHDGAIEGNTSVGLSIDGDSGSQDTEGVHISGMYFEQAVGSPTADIEIGPTTTVYGVGIEDCYFGGVNEATMRHIDINHADRVTIRGGFINDHGVEAASIRANATNTTNFVIDNVKIDGTVTGLPASTLIIDPATSVTPQSVGGANAAGTSHYPARADHVHEGSTTVTAAQIAAMGFVGPIVMVPGITSPPEPVLTPDGAGYVYSPVG
jgi:hypothetical protein